jgi:O-antigen ligase
MFLLFVLGGRGPLLSVLISLLIPLVFRNNLLQSNKKRIKKYAAFIVILLLALIIISVCLYLRNTLTATLYRMLLFLEPGMGTSAGTRMGYYLNAIKLWLLNPVYGYGIGSWPILIGLPDMNSYPHNLILEVLVELGLTGLILFGSTVFIAIRGFIRSNNCKIIFLGSVILMMFANAFISSMLSGDINDNRIIFAVLGLMAFEGSENEKEDMRSDNSS